MVTDSDESSEAAFDLLVAVLTDLHTRQKRTLMQGVKPRMQHASMGNFSEGALGFSSFGEFAREAERRGLVECRPEPGGVSLYLPGEPRTELAPARPTPPRSRPASSSRKMRPDLWVAFVDWDMQFMRVWDREEQRALRLPAKPAPLETPDQAALRERIATDTGRYVQIAPISIDRQLEWMRTFARQHDTTPIGPALSAALDPGVARPVKAFAQMLRVDPGLLNRWNVQRLALVAEHVTAWATAEGVELTLWEELEVKPTASSPDRPSRTRRDSGSARPLVALAADATDEELRGIIRRAVDRMDRNELLRLPVTLRLLIDDPA